MEKRAACSAGDEFRNLYTDGFNENREDWRENDILKYSKASITTYGLPICLLLDNFKTTFYDHYKKKENNKILHFILKV